MHPICQGLELVMLNISFNTLSEKQIGCKCCPSPPLLSFRASGYILIGTFSFWEICISILPIAIRLKVINQYQWWWNWCWQLALVTDKTTLPTAWRLLWSRTARGVPILLACDHDHHGEHYHYDHDNHYEMVMISYTRNYYSEYIVLRVSMFFGQSQLSSSSSSLDQSKV